ncbi:MAG: Crotonobetainyl-CoA:carnitine CoA-transferase CaiB [Chloroflexi bacterium]|nr:MAG: Crotonobetainyl-CoA:carnitine CoA-transferase CaiB [Chloroflexota bacterium]
MTGVLDGIRAIEFGMAWAGPLAMRFLGDLGADVIKIERRDDRGAGLGGGSEAVARAERDEWEWGRLPGPTFRAGVYPNADPGERPWNRAGTFNKLHRNKRALCMDLKTPAGWDAFERLVRSADILFDNFSPRGVLSLGIDAAAMHALNPRLIRVSMSGYGATGPDRNNVSYGPILEGASGLVSATGYPDGGPIKEGHAYPDPIGGLHGAFGILAALWERERTGLGTTIEISQLETYAAIGGELLLQTSVEGAPAPRGNRSRRYAPQGVYRCAADPGIGNPDIDRDDAWLAITIRSDTDWAALVEEIGAAELRDPSYAAVDGRRAAQDAIDAAIGGWTRDGDKHALAARLQVRGIAAAAVMTNKDLVEDPQLNDRGLIVEWDQPEVGPRRYAGFPIHFSEWAPPEMRPTPGLGQDNQEILRELGFDDGEIAQMQSDGVIATTPTPS